MSGNLNETLPGVQLVMPGKKNSRSSIARDYMHEPNNRPRGVDQGGIEWGGGGCFIFKPIPTRYIA